MEASAMARPIVTADSPGCREVVADGRTGYLCRVRDARDLASKMEFLIKLPIEAKMEMGRRGREYMHYRFDERQTSGAYMASLAEL
jgi:glycosyltransferase involved in cell wall biosynthesis